MPNTQQQLRRGHLHGKLYPMLFHQLQSQVLRSAFTFTFPSVIVWGFSAMERSFAML